MTSIGKRWHFQPIHVIMAIKRGIASVRLSHGRREFVTSIAFPVLINLGKADHDTTLVDFEGLLASSAIVTVGLVPSVGL